MFDQIEVNLLAQTFQVEGTIKCIYFPQNGTKISEQETGFTVSVNANNWLIRTDFGKGWYSLHGCDGTNIYAINYDPHPVGSDHKTEVELSVLPCHITDGVYPLDTAYYTTLPWLVFASSYFLDSNTNELPSFWGMPRSSPMSWIFEPQIERSTVPPRLPLNIQYVTSSGKITLATHVSELRVESLAPQEKISRELNYTNISAGELGGKFLVDATTNFNNLEIPTRFRGITFLPKSVFSHEHWGHTNQIFIGTVTKISVPTNTSYLPPINTDVYVTDFRFRDQKIGVDYIQYSNTNQQWISGVDSNLVVAFKKKKAEALSMNTQTIRKIILYIIFILFFSFPAFVLVKSWVKKTKKSKTT